MLEQATPDVILTSSKADDDFMDVLRDHGAGYMRFFDPHTLSLRVADGAGGTFQVRPHKDFIPIKGRDRLLSLRLLTELCIDDASVGSAASETGSASEPRNAYDFMRRRRKFGGDPALQTWNASVRLAN